MKINKIINFSCVDGPGNRLVVFFQGCNFNCLYCHNPETIEYESDGYFIQEQELYEKILQAKNYISGITLSGGECSLQYKSIIELCKLLKKENMEVMVDTNFSLESSVYELLSDYIDFYIVDFKTFSEDIHMNLTGNSNKQVLKNIKLFHDKIFEIRVVIIPSYNDTIEEIESIFKFIKNLNTNINVKLIKYRPYGVRKEFKDVVIPSDVEMEKFVDLGRNLGLKNIYYK